MAIRVTCPHCRAGFKVADHLEGRTVRCLECDERVPVPEEERRFRADDRPRGRGEEFAPRERRRSSDDDDAPPRRSRYADDDDFPPPKRSRYPDDDELPTY